MMNKHILGLDIGSSTICAALCVIGKHQEVQLRGVGHAPALGLVKGRLHSAEHLNKAIEKAIQKAELSAGFRAEDIVFSIPGCYISTVTSEGLLPTKNHTGKIKPTDTIECVKRSQQNMALNNCVHLHTFPIQFKVDGIPVTDPIGKKGVHLEVQTHSILGNQDFITTLSHLLKRRRLNILGVSYEALAQAELMGSESEKSSGLLLIDIGGRFTKVTLFEKSVLQKTQLFPIGGDTLTSDIAYCLKLTSIDAEKLKRQAATLYSNTLDPNDAIEITVQGQKRFINTLYLSRIIQARLQELFDMIKKSFPTNTMPAHIILSGGSSKLAGLQPWAQSCLERQVRFGLDDALSSKYKKPEIASAVGLVIYYQKMEKIKQFRARGLDPLSRFNKWIREFF